MNITDLITRKATGPDGQQWFCAKDVYQQLGITWSGASMKKTPADWRTMLPVITEKGIRYAVFINKHEVTYLLKQRANKVMDTH